jgi:hypothetical protein
MLYGLLPFRNNYEIMNVVDIWLDSLVGDQLCRKTATYMGQHKHSKIADIHASSGIRTHYPSVWAGDDPVRVLDYGLCVLRSQQNSFLNPPKRMNSSSDSRMDALPPTTEKWIHSCSAAHSNRHPTNRSSVETNSGSVKPNIAPCNSFVSACSS